MLETGPPVVVGAIPGLSPCVIEYAARWVELLERGLGRVGRFGRFARVDSGPPA